MDFWIGLVLFCLVCLLLVNFLSEYKSKSIPYILLFVLFFISAFRYMIGWDYESYIMLFYRSEIGDVYPEISFILLSSLLRNLGFDYQIVFIFYAFFTFLFLWKGIRNYTDSSHIRVLALILFTLSPFLYWFSFNAIRQSLAIVIVFWGFKYVLSREFCKYILVILFASLWHYSSVVLILFYWFTHKKYSKKILIALLLFSVFLTAFDIVPLILTHILSFIGIYEGYLDYESSNFSTGLSLLFLLGVFFIALFSNLYTNRISVLMGNMYFISIIIMPILNFSAALYRIKVYFEIFGVVFISIVINELNMRYKTKAFYIVLLPFVYFFLIAVSNVSINPMGFIHPYFSAMNINYEFNFNIFQ